MELIKNNKNIDTTKSAKKAIICQNLYSISKHHVTL